MGRTRQYAERVNVIKYVKTNERWRFAAAVEKDGRLLRDRVWIEGRDEHHPEGRYYLEWYQGGKRRRQSVHDFSQVAEAARRKSIEVNAERVGIISNRQETEPARISIAQAIDEYLEFIKAHRKKRTHITYRYTLEKLLRQSYRKPFADQVTREDILEFMTDCYKQGLGKRTVYDKVVVVLQLFKRHGKANLLKPGDWPDYVERIRPIYQAGEIERMFEVADDREAALITFLLCSGFRDQEARFTEWPDLDFPNHLVRVTAKPHWGFTPKNWEERSVPLPEGLLKRLEKLNGNHRRAGELIFPNSRGKPDSEMDAIIKRLAQRAGLNCGRCVTKHGNKCASGPYCQNYFLHKFRHTFATEHLRSGVDIKTLQGWMGHRDIKSTMVYLKGVQSKDALAKVNGGTLAEYAQPAGRHVSVRAKRR